MKITVINGTEKHGVTYKMKEIFLEEFRNDVEITEYYLPKDIKDSLSWWGVSTIKVLSFNLMSDIQFPDWSYIQINESSRYIAGEFGSYDRVYFFIGFISHKDYYRYVATLRKDNVSFGYMNGEVNIEKNIVQIYNDIMEGEQ